MCDADGRIFLLAMAKSIVRILMSALVVITYSSVVIYLELNIVNTTTMMNTARMMVIS